MTRAGQILIAWIALAACGGGGGANRGPTTPATSTVEQPAGQASCQQAIDHLFSITAAQEPPDLQARISKVFLNRCQTDRWSAELLRCMAAVKVPEDGDACEKMLTPEQNLDLRHDLSRELDAAGIKPEVQSGKPRPAKNKADEKAKDSPRRPSDPCEGGE